MKVLNQIQRNASILRFLGINLLGLALIGLAYWSFKKADTENKTIATKQIQDQAGIIKVIGHDLIRRDTLLRLYLHASAEIDSSDLDAVLYEFNRSDTLLKSLVKDDKLKANNDSLSRILIASTTQWKNWLQEIKEKPSEPVISTMPNKEVNIKNENRDLNKKLSNLNNKLKKITENVKSLTSYLAVAESRRDNALENKISNKELDTLKQKAAILMSSIKQ